VAWPQVASAEGLHLDGQQEASQLVGEAADLVHLAVGPARPDESQGALAVEGAARGGYPAEERLADRDEHRGPIAVRLGWLCWRDRG